MLSAIVAAVLLLRPARLPALIVVTPSDAGNLAIWPNVAGANAGNLLAAWASEGGDRPRLLRPPSEIVKPDDWAAGLDEVPEDSVVVYFCLHGGVDAEGEPFLWLVPREARSPLPEYRLKVRSILTRLSQLPERKRKLVIFDATQHMVGYPQGQIHNDFARALKKLDPQIEQIPNLVVWCSCDEDQRSWVSEEWQVSIFAHFLVEGLKGAVGTDRVTVEALHSYLQRELPGWAQSRRGEAQTPLLLPTRTGADRARRIELSTVSAKRYSPPEPAAAPGANLAVAEDLARAWQRRDALATAVPPPHALAPHRWRRYLDSLLRIELMARQGLPAAEIRERLAQLAREEPLLTRSPWPDLTSTGSSLALPSALGLRSSQPSDERPVQALLADPVQEWPRWREAAAARGESELLRLRHEIAAAILHEVVREDRPQLLPQAARTLEVVFGSELAPVEVHWLRLLARDLDTNPRPPHSLIRESLRVQMLAEQTALLGGAGSDEYPAFEYVLSWIVPNLLAADTERLGGFDRLLSSDARDWDQAAELFAKATEKYQAITRMAGSVRQAWAARNTIFAELPYFGRWVAGLPNDLDAADRRRWLEWVETIAEGAHRL
ncbi:MAG: caspase family protein, partial [Gemmataceae bacterium]|nr:caspase family protein [Gemmataceae bacterium]